MVRRRLAYEADPAGFAAECQADERFLAQRILDAEKRLGQVLLTDEARAADRRDLRRLRRRRDAR